MNVLLTGKKQANIKLVIISGGSARSPLSRDDALTFAQTFGANAVAKQHIALDERICNVRKLIGD